ncbi:MAG: DnaA regulatory inactivator Hda [Gammaproteobacteria bacterium RIFCSPHIGHO2_12_FULL_45_9]|nr:MAG: DnaA regulatory inactivator Hda [Gammaproteobacteria bacterium RIFCSPHIGHO2_12_FULL_45_9]
MIEQLTLKIRPQEDATFENFVGQANAALVAHLSAIAESRMTAGGLYLWGTGAVGCSHLLQAMVHRTEAVGLTALYLCFKEIGLAPACLEDLDVFSCVMLDDIEVILGDLRWEEALFHCMNRILQAGGSCILAGHLAPAELACVLPDLRSRIGWGGVFQVAQLTDEEKGQLLQTRARLRGFVLPDDVIHFLLRSQPRDVPALLHILDHLDGVSLSAKRRLTVPFVREALRTA